MTENNTKGNNMGTNPLLDENVSQHQNSETENNKYGLEMYPSEMPDDYKQTYDQFLSKVLSLQEPIHKHIEGDSIEKFKYFNDRYFDNYYSTSTTNSESGKDTVHNDILVRVHSNKLVVLALARGHCVCSSGRKVEEVSFVINKSDRSVIRTKGKKKAGAKDLSSQTILCRVKLEGSADMINIRAGVPGYLVEVNEHIKRQPNLLVEEPTGLGYIGIVFPKGRPANFKATVSSWGLLSEEDYTRYLEKRNVASAVSD